MKKSNYKPKVCRVYEMDGFRIEVLEVWDLEYEVWIQKETYILKTLMFNTWKVPYKELENRILDEFESSVELYEDFLYGEINKMTLFFKNCVIFSLLYCFFLYFMVEYYRKNNPKENFNNEHCSCTVRRTNLRDKRLTFRCFSPRYEI